MYVYRSDGGGTDAGSKIVPVRSTLAMWDACLLSTKQAEVRLHTLESDTACHQKCAVTNCFSFHPKSMNPKSTLHLPCSSTNSWHAPDSCMLACWSAWTLRQMLHHSGRWTSWCKGNPEKKPVTKKTLLRRPSSPKRHCLGDTEYVP